jgi:hypothetical protein
MERPNTSSEGSLYELVARGQKDVFFLSQKEDALVPFSYTMGTWPATINETRQTQALNAVDFGRSVEWEFEVFGDVLKSVALTVELPTWLPIYYANLNRTTTIRDASGASYGYCQGVGAFLFESIQFYQDQLLLQEFSGDFLYAWTHLQGTLNQEALALKEFGAHNGTVLDIQHNATPNTLYLRLPLIGASHPDDGGLPFVALPAQKFRVRCKLRKLEDLVESSDSQVKPTPWTRTDLVCRDVNNNSFPVVPLSRQTIGKPVITLETTQQYVRQDLQNELKKTEIQIPFIRPFENVLTLDPNDYVSVGNGGTSYVTKRIDGRHPSEGLLVFFQSQYDVDRNRLWSLKNPFNQGAFYNTMKLIIAGKDRETEWPADIWENISPGTKSEKTSGLNLSWLSVSYGPCFGYRAPEIREPSGTINFTKADRPTLYMDIIDTLPSSVSSQKRTYVRAITIGWGLYIVSDGRGSLRFAN